jgi:acetyltransferase-like isoleucine patch superfamily enzyme
MNIGYNVFISRRAILDKSINPKGIHIGDNTLISGNVVLLCHDFCRGIMSDVYIGKKCFIGHGAIILPGIKIGDEVIVGAGSVVTKNVPSNCIVAGNPARVIRENIHTDIHGKLID